MRSTQRQAIRQYGVALLVTTLAVGLQYAVNPALEHRLPYMALFPAIAAAVWYGGWGPALMTASLGYLSINWLSLGAEDNSPLSLGRPGGLIGLLLFVVSSAVIIALGQGMRTARMRAESFAEHALSQAHTLKQGMIDQQQTVHSLRVDRWKLESAHRHKDEFLAVLAHELRSPLSAAATACELSGLPNATPADIDESRTIIRNQLRQAARLIDDLLDLNRIVRGKFALRPVQMDLVAAVRRAVETCCPSIEAASHDLQLDLPPEPIWMSGDPARLSQVVINLLNNACKYTPRGGVLRLSVRQQDGQAVIRIRDNGLGIRPELLPRLFDMFTQAEDAAVHSPGGLGVGLALVRQLVELHQGTVEALSPGPGQGSEFIVWLPILATLKSSTNSIDAGEYPQESIVSTGTAAAQSLERTTASRV